MSKKIDMVGKKYNRLTVLCEYDRDKYGAIRYLCECDCGNEVIALGRDLRNGKTKSCGCYKKEVLGMNRRKYTKEEKILYTIWLGMKQRCDNKNQSNYFRYGGRGVHVCDEWYDYLEFYHWAIKNGYEKGKQIDRINNDGNYEPSNCRWVTPIENSNNKSNVNHFVINGVTHTLTEWCQIYNIKRNLVKDRLSRGIDIEKALTTPLLNNKGKVIGKVPTYE